MLRDRDWSPIAGMKVDRKDMEALRVANDLQVEGAVREEDTSFAFDSTPAANKVERTQIDQGDMVKIITQALEIRLGKVEIDGVETGTLNGAQTSAAMMASDFLLEELSRIEANNPPAAAVVDVRNDLEGTLGGGRPTSAMASGGYAAAYGFDTNEYDSEGTEREEAEMASLFGGGGIPMTSDPDD